MKNYLLIYGVTLVTLVVVDGLWLTMMSKRFYAIHLAGLMADSVKFLPIVIFYLLYALGLTVILIVPSVRDQVSLINVFLLSAFFGLVAYGTYDLTNQGTLKDWPTVVTLVDLAWGMVVTGLTATIATAVAKYFS